MKEDKSHVSKTSDTYTHTLYPVYVILRATDVFLSLQLENLQKRIFQLEEQLHSEMQLKDELEQKCRYSLATKLNSKVIGYLRKNDAKSQRSHSLLFLFVALALARLTLMIN